MRNESLAQGWIALVGVILVAVGVLGFVDNPLVGKAKDALIDTNEVHNVVHLATGLLAVYIAFGLRGAQRATGVFAFGLLYAAIFVVVVISPNLFGLFGDHASDLTEHAIHAGTAIVSLALGWMARSGSSAWAS